MSLDEVLRQTNAALVCVDASRLDVLARICQRMSVREGATMGKAHLRMAEEELQILRRTLDETRANLTVLDRLYKMRLNEQVMR